MNYWWYSILLYLWLMTIGSWHIMYFQLKYWANYIHLSSTSYVQKMQKGYRHYSQSRNSINSRRKGYTDGALVHKTTAAQRSETHLFAWRHPGKSTRSQSSFEERSSTGHDGQKVKKHPLLNIGRWRGNKKRNTHWWVGLHVWYVHIRRFLTRLSKVTAARHFVCLIHQH